MSKRPRSHRSVTPETLAESELSQIIDVTDPSMLNMVSGGSTTNPVSGPPYMPPSPPPPPPPPPTTYPGEPPLPNSPVWTPH